MKNSFYFLPLLIGYILIITFFFQNQLRGDEGVYINFAENISQGYYTPKDDINLLNGPGYPIILTPYVLLNIPWAYAKYQNAIFLFLAVIYFYNILRLYCSQKLSVLLAFLLGLYFPFYSKIIYISPDIFFVFLICGLIFHYIKIFKDDKRNNLHLIISSFFFGYLIITDVVFGYIFSIFILLSVVVYLFKKNPYIKKTIYTLLLAFILSAPYLIYTYSLTGKSFYWSNSFGGKLYWLSTPYEEEFGDWHHSKHFNLYPKLKDNHYDFWKSLRNLNNVERDEVLLKKAFENANNHPVKFFINWISGLGRFFISYPFSYTNQKLSTFFYLIPNFSLILISIFAFYIQKKMKIKIPTEINLILLFGLLFLFIKSFLNAGVNDFFLLVPFLVIYISIIKSNVQITTKLIN